MVTSYLPLGYKYLVEDEKFSSPTNFECNLRIRGVKTEEDARAWIDLLNECSLVTWKVLRTYPNSGKVNVYKGEFRCQHRVHGKRKDMKKSKNTNCPARLRVCIRRYLKSTNAKVPDPLNKLWPCIVELVNTHNHAVESADSLQYRPVNEVTRRKVNDLFDLGHSPNSISESLRLDLLIESPESYDERENDASYCPLPPFCYREYIRLFGHSYRGRLKNSLQSELESLLSPYINDVNGGRAVMSSVSDHLVVCICTPIMQNVHALVSESRSIVHLQVFGHPDKKSKLFLFSTWINIGEMPLGVILSDTEEIDVFSTGLQLLKSIFPPNSFFGSNFPQVFAMPDDSTARRTALETEFPFSIILTSKTHHLRLFHDFLSDPKNAFSRDGQLELHKKFKVMLNSPQEELSGNFSKISNSKVPPTVDLPAVLNQLWTESNGFAHVYRPGIFVTPSEACPALEGTQILSRMLTAEIFDRVKSFNLVQLSHFVIRTFEEFMRRRLTMPNYVEVVLKALLPGKGVTNLHKVRKVTDALYEVPGDECPSLVEVDLLRCSCSRGHKICPHLSAVIHKYFSPTIPYPVHLSDFYVDLAGGQGQVRVTENGGHVTLKKSPLLLPKMKKTPLPVSVKVENVLGGVEHETLLTELSDWFKFHLSKSPARFGPALKSMLRKMDSIESESEALAAVAGFGVRQRPIQLRGEVGEGAIRTEVVQPPPPLVAPTVQVTAAAEEHVTFVTALEGEMEEGDLMAGISNSNATYIPLQEIPGEDGNPAYFILVSGEEEGREIFSTVEEPLPVISVISNLKSPPLPVSIVPKRKVTKKSLEQ